MQDYVEELRNHGKKIEDLSTRMAVVEEQNKVGLDFHKDVQLSMTEVQVGVGRIEGKLDVVLENGNGVKLPKTRLRKTGEGTGIAGIIVAAVVGIVLGIIEGIQRL